MPPEQFSGETAVVCGPDHVHLARVLRVRVGDPVILLDNLGGAFHGTVQAVDKIRTLVGIDGSAEVKLEPDCRILAAQALGKGDKFEQVIQHGTEAGASSFLPIRAERCVVDIRKEGDRAGAQLARWNQIAKGAAEQCGRSRIPPVLTALRSLDLFSKDWSAKDWSARDGAAREEARFILHPGGDSVQLRTALASPEGYPKSVVIAIGPEGGWSPNELAAAKDSGWRQIRLGSYVLRTETAALVAVSQIMFCLEVSNQ